MGEFAGHRGLLEAVKDLQPDVLLMDLFMPEESGLSVARRVRLVYPDLRMVLMSSIDNPALYADARNVGVNAFVAKTAPAADFITALVGADSSSKTSTTVLSDREIQVVELLAMGASNEEISAGLHLSQNTVKTYVSRAMDKTDTTNRVQLFQLVSRARRVASARRSGGYAITARASPEVDKFALSPPGGRAHGQDVVRAR